MISIFEDEILWQSHLQRLRYAYIPGYLPWMSKMRFKLSSVESLLLVLFGERIDVQWESLDEGWAQVEWNDAFVRSKTLGEINYKCIRLRIDWTVQKLDQRRAWGIVLHELGHLWALIYSGDLGEWGHNSQFVDCCDEVFQKLASYPFFEEV